MIFVTQEKEIYIYNNINESNSTPVKLNLDFYKRYSLFNGQLVIIKGRNLGNNELLVQNINCLPCLDHEPQKKDLNCHIKVVGHSNTNLDLTADVVLLIGCELPETYKQTPSNFIHIPTMEDLDNIEMYPMNPSICKMENVLCLGNPCTFKLENKLFCVNTLKILDLLKLNELSCNDEIPKNDPCGNLLFSDDIITRLCYHLVFQRSFVPIIDVKKVKYEHESIFMPVCPDYYIIRSDYFDPFCRDIGPTKVINIGSNYNWDIFIKEKVLEMNLIN